MIATLLAVVLGATQFISAQSGVRLRETAAADGKEIALLPIGEVLTQVAPPGASVNVGGKDGTWENVSTADGKKGFIFSTGLAPVTDGDTAKTYLTLWEARRNNKKLSFAERADLFVMLERAVNARTGDAKYKQVTVDLELARLRALNATLVKMEQAYEKKPHKGFLKEYEKYVVYSEPAGEWFAQADDPFAREDDLRKHDLDTDAFGWEIAELMVPGECEGNFGCMIARDNMSVGEYIKRHPTGAHVTEAAKGYIEYKKTLKELADLFAEADRQDYDDTLKGVDEAVTFLSASNAKNKAAAIASLNAVKKEAAKAKKAAPPSAN